VSEEKVRLTQLSHGGGCGCKIAPGVLQKILAGVPSGIIPPQLLVGIETCDDAAVYQINDTQAIVATTDFFMPIVDDPFDFGRIAATNAISDIYAMGGTPLFALAIVGMPVNTLPMETIRLILEGGESVCAGRPGFRLPAATPSTRSSRSTASSPSARASGQPEAQHRRAAGRQADSRQGAGRRPLQRSVQEEQLLGARLRGDDRLDHPAQHAGFDAGCLDGVHAMTDVTGFGLAGHLLEVCQGSGVRATVRYADLPLLPHARELIEAGFQTGASARNWASYGDRVNATVGPEKEAKTLLSDPQTSGGLLVACSPETVTEVLSLFLQQGFSHVSVIGELGDGEPGIDVI
jgi:selenide,water dikinase